MLTPRLDILPAAQQSLWPRLAETPDHFVLYGGTAIALRLGHRVSVDFDFFSHREFDEAQKNKILLEISWLAGASVLQNEKNTLTVSVVHAGSPIKISFFGGFGNGCVREPDKTDDGVLCVASLDDLFSHKLKVIHDRAEAKDYQDIAVMLENGQTLAHGLAAMEALFGSSVPPMVTLKALAYFRDINEPWRLTEPMKSVLATAMKQLPKRWNKVTIASRTLSCRGSKSNMV